MLKIARKHGMLNISQAAKLMQISRAQLTEAMKLGCCPPRFRIGKMTFFRAEDCEPEKAKQWFRQAIVQNDYYGQAGEVKNVTPKRIDED